MSSPYSFIWTVDLFLRPSTWPIMACFGPGARFKSQRKWVSSSGVMRHTNLSSTFSSMLGPEKSSISLRAASIAAMLRELSLSSPAALIHSNSSFSAARSDSAFWRRSWNCSLEISPSARMEMRLSILSLARAILPWMAAIAALLLLVSDW